LAGLEVFVAFADGFLAFMEVLEVADLELDVGLVDGDDFLVEVLDLGLEGADVSVHTFDVLLALAEALAAFVLLLLEVLLEEAEVAGAFVVNLLAAALPAGRGRAETTRCCWEYQWCRFTPRCWLNGCLQMLQFSALANSSVPFSFRPGTFSMLGAA
jgi:hypothetical protein